MVFDALKYNMRISSNAYCFLPLPGIDSQMGSRSDLRIAYRLDLQDQLKLKHLRLIHELKSLFC